MRREKLLFPHPMFPLAQHRNGQWCVHIWDKRTRRPRTHYFGAIASDPRGERALYDPVAGYLARSEAIKAGRDQTRESLQAGPGDITLGELIKRYLQHVKDRVEFKELSLRTFDSYLRELKKFGEFVGVSISVTTLGPTHFADYMHHLQHVRRLGNCARRRVRTDITAMLNYGCKNGWYTSVPTGAAWKSPPIDRAALRLTRMRAGKVDYSDRLISGIELNQLLERATPAFRAILLLMINAGLGPADIGRMRWRHVDLSRGRLVFARQKTGVERRAYLWKKTRHALKAVRKLKRIESALARDGEDALVFISEKGNAMYRESLRLTEVFEEGKRVEKVAGVKVENAVSITVRRLIRACGLPPGLRPYSLRHSAKTYAKAARDVDAVNLMMGHQDRSVPAMYDHEPISWCRLKRVSIAIRRKLWPKVKRKGEEHSKLAKETAAALPCGSV